MHSGRTDIKHIQLFCILICCYSTQSAGNIAFMLNWLKAICINGHAYERRGRERETEEFNGDGKIQQEID